jgi:hypothetical protein
MSAVLTQKRPSSILTLHYADLPGITRTLYWAYTTLDTNNGS